MNIRIPITKPFLQPIEEYRAYVTDICEREWLTNDGPLVQQPEERLQECLGVENLLYVSNGTTALQFDIESLKLECEIITPPFSYIATTSSIVWEGCWPVFADIDPGSLNLDPSLFEESAIPAISAIPTTHTIGNPCDISSILKVAKKHNLKVKFDAPHCFGTTYMGESVYGFGDISTTSFHTTKVFQTVEGGAVITNDHEYFSRMDYMHNFGRYGPVKYRGVGINGKNSEFHAVMGLCNLKHANEILTVRKRQSHFYDRLLRDLNTRKPDVLPDSVVNHSHSPLIFESGSAVIESQRRLEKANVQTRGLFFSKPGKAGVCGTINNLRMQRTGPKSTLPSTLPRASAG